MSLPKEIQDVVDKLEAAGGYDASEPILALFTEDYIMPEDIKDEINHEIMEIEGGGEGEGEHCYSVIRVGDKFFKAEWSYYSYNGCDFDYINDTIKEVTPSEKTITVYN